jgi:hypothetical protein
MLAVDLRFDPANLAGCIGEAASPIKRSLKLATVDTDCELWAPETSAIAASSCAE